MLPFGLALLMLAAGAASASECPVGEAANEREGWEWIANNAIRTADEHAVENNPAATFALGEVSAYYQVSGDHEGKYLVMVTSPGSNVAFAVLEPNFDFCSDPAQLDDARPDLFQVFSAKLNGVPY